MIAGRPEIAAHRELVPGDSFLARLLRLVSRDTQAPLLFDAPDSLRAPSMLAYPMGERSMRMIRTARLGAG